MRQTAIMFYNIEWIILNGERQLIKTLNLNKVLNPRTGVFPELHQ